MNRIRVLQIVAGLDIGHTFGGAERCGLALAHHLDHAEVASAVCGFWHTGSAEEARQVDALRDAGIPFFFATTQDEKRESMDFFAGARRIVDWCRANPVDIAHAHHEGGALAALMAKRNGGSLRAIRTAHVPLSLEWGAGIAGFANRVVFSRLVFPLAMDAEVSVSQEHAELLRRRWLARLTRRWPEMIHQAVPRDALVVEPETRQVAGCIILAVGRLTAQKNHRDLIAAMPAVLAVVPAAKLWIVGEGEQRAALLHQIKEARLESAITLWGARENVLALFARATVLALPSVWEGIPVSVVESIGAGVPVVASDLPGVRELIAHGCSGWLVPAHEPAALADALIDALTDSRKRIDYAREAQRVLPEFSMPAIVARHMALYRHVLNHE